MNKSLMIGCLIMATALSVHGATMCSGTSVSVTLDLATGTRTAAASETIRYSTAWVDGAAADAMAVVEVNGEALSSMTGSGAVTWTPQHNGNYTLTHKVMSGGTQIGETLTATFFVEPANPVLNPVGGTTFDSSLSVSMTCPTEGATIHYTTDGSEPTAESPEYKRFKIYSVDTIDSGRAVFIHATAKDERRDDRARHVAELFRPTFPHWRWYPHDWSVATAGVFTVRMGSVLEDCEESEVEK